MAFLRTFGAIGIALATIATPLRAQRGDATSLTPAAIRQDLDAMRTEFLAHDRSYSPAARTEAEQRIARLKAAADTLGRAYFEVEVARIAALADNGHTGVGATQRAAHFNRVGVRFVPFGDDFYVLLAAPANADLLGARLVAIDAHPIAALRASARALEGGIAAWRDRTVPFVLESPQLMQAAAMVAQPDAATYQVELVDGRRIERRLTAAAPDALSPPAGTRRWMFPAAGPTQPAGWQPLISVAQAPWSLRDPATPFRWRDAPELDGIVIELRQNTDSPGNSIGDFLAIAGRELRAKHPRNIVLDMRLNSGGNLNTTRDFAKMLPSLASGRVFVLTSPYTFSAAISTVGYLKQAAPDRVTIVGEPVGDRMMFWAEGMPITLPNSGVSIGLATERHDYATGCKPYTDCHGNVVRNPIAVPTLAPDIVAPWTIAAYRAGRDPGIDAIVKATAKK